MQTDRTTKILLSLIAAALWGLLLKPAFVPIPSEAQPGGPPAVQQVKIVGMSASALPVKLVGMSAPTMPVKIAEMSAPALPVTVKGAVAVGPIPPAKALAVAITEPVAVQGNVNATVTT